MVRRDRVGHPQICLFSTRPNVRLHLTTMGHVLTWYSLENWDETVRRQYEFKREGKPHPYGEEDEADKFNNFHILTKLRVLYQLAAWTFQNPDRMRQHFGEHKEMDQFYDWVGKEHQYGLITDTSLASTSCWLGQTCKYILCSSWKPSLSKN